MPSTQGPQLLLVACTGGILLQDDTGDTGDMGDTGNILLTAAGWYR